MPLHQNGILKIGVTGGIGSGKTTVCEYFLRFGVPVFHSDEIANNLSNSDSDIRKKITAVLGAESYKSDGSLDRQYVASKIFADEKLRHKIEAVIHPRVEEERTRKMASLIKQGHRLFIIEAALIYEAGIDKRLDAVIVVDAEEELRVARVRKRDAAAEENIYARIKAQYDVKKKLEKADFVIYNNGTIEELEFKVRFLYNLFNSLIKEETDV